LKIRFGTGVQKDDFGNHWFASKLDLGGLIGGIKTWFKALLCAFQKQYNVLSDCSTYNIFL
jgi:hypothetical protein